MTKQVLGAMAISLVVSELSLAHACLLGARPSANGVVAGPDVTVELRFNSRIDPARSRLMLVFPDQRFQLLHVQTSSLSARLGARATGLIADRKSVV